MTQAAIADPDWLRDLPKDGSILFALCGIGIALIAGQVGWVWRQVASWTTATLCRLGFERAAKGASVYPRHTRETLMITTKLSLIAQVRHG